MENEAAYPDEREALESTAHEISSQARTQRLNDTHCVAREVSWWQRLGVCLIGTVQSQADGE